MSCPTEKYVIYPHWSRTIRLWWTGYLISQGLVAVNDTPPSRQNFEMVLSCRYAEVLWSWCNRQFAHVCMDTGSASHISQQHVSPVNKCSPNIQCISSEVIVLCILWESVAFSSWINGTQLDADNSSSPTVVNKNNLFFFCFFKRHRVLNHFMFNPLKTGGRGGWGSVTSLEGSYVSPDCPSETNIVKMIEKMIMLEWWQ